MVFRNNWKSMLFSWMTSHRIIIAWKCEHLCHYEIVANSEAEVIVFSIYLEVPNVTLFFLFCSAFLSALCCQFLLSFSPSIFYNLQAPAGLHDHLTLLIIIQIYRFIAGSSPHLMNLSQLLYFLLWWSVSLLCSSRRFLSSPHTLLSSFHPH